MNSGSSDSNDNTRRRVSYWLEALHIAGSVASVTAMTMVATKSYIRDLTFGRLLAYPLAASLTIALIMIFGIGLIEGSKQIRRRFGSTWTAVFWFTGIPVVVPFRGLFMNLIFHVFVPFVILAIDGQYP